MQRRFTLPLLLASIGLVLASCSGSFGLGTGAQDGDTAIERQQEAEPTARITGTVFQDDNGNGSQDEGEHGLPGVMISAVGESNADPNASVVSDESGSYEIDLAVVNHQVSIDSTTLPTAPGGGSYQLSTSRAVYNLNVPPGFTAPNINFGYKPVSPAAVTGIVFEDQNGNGTQDGGEPGLAGVMLRAVHDDTGVVSVRTTGPNGAYRFETASQVKHILTVDEASLPFQGRLTTARQEYHLTVPPGFIAPNVNFGYQEVEPAVATGTVFDDLNGNGTHDQGEPGLADVSLIVVHDETGATSSLTTDTDGVYRFESGPSVNHLIRVDESTLPFFAQLTTGRSEYNLIVPSGFTAPNINFGYQEVEPAVATGTVFDDLDGNGTQDQGEPGLAGVSLIVVHDGTGATSTLTTDTDGVYRFESGPNVNHLIRVDESTLPFFAQLTTGRSEYNLIVPSGFTAPNVNFGYQELDPAAASGFVYEDLDGDGRRGNDEPGLADVTVRAVLADSGAVLLTRTDSAGAYFFEVRETDFMVAVDESTLPLPEEGFGYGLSSARSQYDLNVPFGFTAPNVNFGYRLVDPAVAAGMIFMDSNGNGQRDSGEPGLEGVRISALHQDRTSSTDSAADGRYRLETYPGRFQLDVDMGTLPPPDPGFTWEISAGGHLLEQTLYVPSSFTAPNLDFGFVMLPSPAAAAGAGPGGGGNADGRNPFEDPQPEDEEFPDPDPLAPGAPTSLLPREGPWTAYNLQGQMGCDAGLGFPMPPITEQGTIEHLDDGSGFVGTGLGEGSSLTFSAVPNVLGRYTSTIRISSPVGLITLDYFMQVVTEDQMVGYLKGTVNAEGVTCEVYRPVELEYAGG